MGYLYLLRVADDGKRLVLDESFIQRVAALSMHCSIVLTSSTTQLVFGQMAKKIGNPSNKIMRSI